MGVPGYLLSTTLLCVIAQRLVRTICASCKADYSPEVTEQAWLKLALGDAVGDARLQHGRGCSHCNNSGYAGRASVYEMLEMSGPLAEALSRNHVGDFSRLARQQLQGKTIRSHAIARMLAGETTVAETMRVATQIDE
jgi:MSHA biogenesis protein MshE